MISTVTTSTVSTVSTVTLAGSFAVIGVLVLIGLLVQKELTTSTSNVRVQRLGKYVNIGIAPLLVAFVLIVITKVMEVLK
jgi:hypothetical protein